MIKPFIFALSFIAFIGAVSGLESNPLTKLDRYLRSKTDYWFEPEYNFMLAEEYYEAEKQASHTITSNKKLLEALENFLGLKQLIDGDKEKNCNVQAVEKLTKFGESYGSRIHLFKNLHIVYRNIRQNYAHQCRQKFYAFLDEKLESMKDLDIVVADRLNNLIKAEATQVTRESGETENEVSAMYSMIISKEDSEILDPRHIQDAYGSCENIGSFKESVQKCWLSPCKQYVDELGNIFSIATSVQLEPDVGTLQTPSPETQKYFEHWARFKVCQVLLSRGASQLEKYLQH